MFPFFSTNTAAQYSIAIATPYIQNYYRSIEISQISKLIQIVRLACHRSRPVTMYRFKLIHYFVMYY
jgi:hypothetical protein